MVKSADDEAKLKAVGRNGGPSNPSYRRKTSDLRRIIILPTARGVATKYPRATKTGWSSLPPFRYRPDQLQTFRLWVESPFFCCLEKVFQRSLDP